MSLVRSLFDRLVATPWVLVLAVGLAFFWQLGSVPLYDLDEGAFTEATREMLASGNWITPQMNGEPRYDKPILIYWLQAASATALGFNEFALRLPSALAAALWVLVVWRFVRERLDPTAATVAALAMVLSLQVSLIAKAAVADALLNLFIALTFFEIYRYWLAPRTAPLWRAYLWMALGFLTKGPVAIFFPVLVSLMFFWSTGHLERWWRALFAPVGWLIFVAVAGPWYLAIFLDNGPGFFASFFLDHNVGRFGDAMHGHGGFPGYYFVILPLILLPFTGWFIRILPTLRHAWSDPLERFLWLWFGTVFVVFSFSGTKLPHYLLYGAVPLFILMARHRELLVSRWLAYAPPIFFLVLLLWLPEIVALAAGQAERAHEIALLGEGARVLDLGYRLAVIAGLLATLGLALAAPVRPWQGLVLAGLIQTLVVYGALVPRVFEVMQGPVKEAGLLARELDRPTVVYRTSMPSFSVYRDAVTLKRPPEAGDLVFLRVDRLPSLIEGHPALTVTTLYQRGAVALVELKAGAADG
ncbi:glycosyltransferase family 39 protein [Thioalkalicoccus limnaeus]|uniref:Glycosyltransferase family 39 protein n=1 Tax=Thioalkalicoccus limnaeus TaxID=120681 RepID=A0ABV4BC64_9GAMM